MFALAALVVVAPAPLPAWWSAFLRQPSLEAAFTQESESAVFGTLRKSGTLAVAKGGRLRVAYDGGLLLVSDGQRLVQYDPDARTAQSFQLRAARAEAPLLGFLLDPEGLSVQFEIQPIGVRGIRLKAKRRGLPDVEMDGQGKGPTSIRWTDPSGASQVLRLAPLRTHAAVPPGRFRFEVPHGTRWVEGQGN